MFPLQVPVIKPSPSPKARTIKVNKLREHFSELCLNKLKNLKMTIIIKGKQTKTDLYLRQTDRKQTDNNIIHKL